MKKVINKTKGFTLIELLVVIGIIGILSSFLLANFVGVRQRSRDGVRKSDLRQIQSALELYRADSGNYPTSLDLATKCTDKTPFQDSANKVTYMQKIPCDPLNTSPYIYTYAPSSDGSTYYLTACLENINDSQKDTSNNPEDTSGDRHSICDGTTDWSYTLQNP